MRFSSAILAAYTCTQTVSTTIEPPLDYCNMLCSVDSTCDKTMSSYCKSWLEPAICFAYYFETADKDDGYYYHTEGDNKYTGNPMLCTDAQTIVEPPAIDNCKLLCPQNEACVASEQGSYLKVWQDPQVCFGFYFTNAEKNAYYFWTGEGGDERFPLSNADAGRFLESS